MSSIATIVRNLISQNMVLMSLGNNQCLIKFVLENHFYVEHLIIKFLYYFRSEMDYKVNKTWNENGTVTFHRRRFWTFEPSMSSGSLSDEITNLNPIAVVNIQL